MMNSRGIVPLVFALIIAASVIVAGALIAYKPVVSCTISDVDREPKTELMGAVTITPSDCYLGDRCELISRANHVADGDSQFCMNIDQACRLPTLGGTAVDR